jgi:hypothetical protein
MGLPCLDLVEALYNDAFTGGEAALVGKPKDLPVTSGFSSFLLFDNNTVTASGLDLVPQAIFRRSDQSQ